MRSKIADRILAKTPKEVEKRVREYGDMLVCNYQRNTSNEKDLNKTSGMESKNITDQFDEIFTYTTEEEQLEHDAQMLAFQFLSKIDKVMADRNISKKEIAHKIGTSASFITQLFQGNRKPTWDILAKFQKELKVDFKVVLQGE